MSFSQNDIIAFDTFNFFANWGCVYPFSFRNSFRIVPNPFIFPRFLVFFIILANFFKKGLTTKYSKTIMYIS